MSSLFIDANDLLNNRLNGSSAKRKDDDIEVSSIIDEGEGDIVDVILEDGEINELPYIRLRYKYSNYSKARSQNYPSIGDQLDALWKGGNALIEMQARIMAVKEKYPKE
jgi:hypothetical protein